jgi:hypothetical protein
MIPTTSDTPAEKTIPAPTPPKESIEALEAAFPIRTLRIGE